MLKLNSKLLAILLSVLLVPLSGCSNAVDQKDLKDAEGFCTGKEGIYKIWINGTYGRTWECKNGMQKDIIKPD